MTAALLTFADIACVRADRLVFRGLSFTVAAGQALWLVGGNGAGKSSAIRLAAGLLRPASGSVRAAAAVALADEALALDAELPLSGALNFWGRIDRASPAALAAARAAMGLDALAEVPVGMLSTGQRKRASLARVAASGAPLWLLDEPANGLDRAALGWLAAAIARHRAGGGAVVMASHSELDVPGNTRIDLDPLR